MNVTRKAHKAKSPMPRSRVDGLWETADAVLLKANQFLEMCDR